LEEIMANSARGGANDFNTEIIEEFRANEGRVGGPFAGATMILIHHIGAKSGIERVSPLGCFPQGDTGVPPTLDLATALKGPGS
jgi:hypothetical protein